MSVWRAIFAYEMPKSPSNFRRYLGCIVVGTLILTFLAYDSLPIWQGLIIFYLGMRLLCWLLQFTPFAKPEMLE